MRYTEEYWKDVEKVIHRIPRIDKINKKSVLITGATGMICSSVLDLLIFLKKRNNAQITIYLAGRDYEKIKNRFSGALDSSDYTYIRFDATERKNIEIGNIDYIIHGASNANPSVYAKEPVATLLGNIIGLNNILDSAKGNTETRVLYISSSEVYGNRLNEANTPYKEDDYGFVDILNPRACYPNGKRAAETLCACYSQQYGVDTVIVRPGHIYGPSITDKDSRASAQFTRDAYAGRNIVMKSSGSQLRSYCYTLDCASAILAVLLNGQKGNAYNISNNKSVVSIRDIAEEMAKAGGVEVVFSNPTDTERKSYNLMSNSSLDASKIESLGWSAEFSLQEGVKRTLLYL